MSITSVFTYRTIIVKIQTGHWGWALGVNSFKSSAHSLIIFTFFTHIYHSNDPWGFWGFFSFQYQDKGIYYHIIFCSCKSISMYIKDCLYVQMGDLTSSGWLVYLSIYIKWAHRCLFVCLSVGVLRPNGNPNPCMDLNRILHAPHHPSKGRFWCSFDPCHLTPLGLAPETLKA